MADNREEQALTLLAWLNDVPGPLSNVAAEIEQTTMTGLNADEFKADALAWCRLSYEERMVAIDWLRRAARRLRGDEYASKFYPPADYYSRKP